MMIGTLRDAILSAVPRISFGVKFQGQKEAAIDSLGPPREIQEVSLPADSVFIDYSLWLESSGAEALRVCVYQFKRAKGSVVRVAPHEMLRDEETLVLEAATGDERYEAMDSTRSKPDDALYCLLISSGPVPAGEIRSLAKPSDEGDPIVWAADLVGRLEESRWFREGNVVLRTILIRLQEG